MELDHQEEIAPRTESAHRCKAGRKLASYLRWVPNQPCNSEDAFMTLRLIQTDLDLPAAQDLPEFLPELPIYPVLPEDIDELGSLN